MENQNFFFIFTGDIFTAKSQRVFAKYALGKDSSFHYVSFGMTVCAWRKKAETTAALWALPLFPPTYPADFRHSELRGTKQEESQKANTQLGLTFQK